MSTVMACALSSLALGSKFPLYHLNMPSLQALVMLVVSVVSDNLISENAQVSLAFSVLLNSDLANTLKNLDASCLVIVLFGKKSAKVALDVSPAVYIQSTAVFNSSVVAVSTSFAESPVTTLVHTASPSMTTKASIIFLHGPATYFPSLIIALLHPLSNWIAL